MIPNPLLDTLRRKLLVSFLAMVAAAVQVFLLVRYTTTPCSSAILEGVVSVLLFCILVYLSWFVIYFVSLPQSDILLTLSVMSCWLAGSFGGEKLIVWSLEAIDHSFLETLPFRVFIGLPVWISILLWYRLQLLHKEWEEEKETIADTQEALKPAEKNGEEQIERITVKDGARIHLISSEDLLYIQACGDYVLLITRSGQYLKEQTMKYFETHLPAEEFVRVHRSSIVNVRQISRVELFGKENYQLLLKNGEKVKVSNSGYRLLKERLSL